MYISVKMATLLVPLTPLFRQVTSNLHVEYPWAQKFNGLDFNLETFGLGLEDLWPWR